MKRLLYISLLLPALFLFTGCPNGYRFDVGKFPYDPVNLADANSEYDDYNMSSPVIEGWRFLYFSSNRNSSGNNLDIVGSNFHILWDKDKGTLTVDDSPADWMNLDYVDSLFILMNTVHNEYGPYNLIWNTYDGTNAYSSDIIVYASDDGGDMDLKLVSYKWTNGYPSSDNGTYTGPGSIAKYNSDFNDAYLAFYGPDFVPDWGIDPSGISEAYFCSDRGGDFDIYMAGVPVNNSIVDYLLSDGSAEVEAVEVLNSGSQDKCPYIEGQLLVFASDRPGGYGGYDLYYSRRDGNTWSAPVNFGSRINTEYNEYRPIAMTYYYEFQNDLMLFSSDRPGGKGGYDLYYVGIPRMIY